MVRIVIPGQQKPELSEEEQLHQDYINKKREKLIKRMKVSEEELDAINFPVHLRDVCVRWSIKLEKCRTEHFYMPFQCDDEIGRYERCQYKQYVLFLFSL